MVKSADVENMAETKIQRVVLDRYNGRDTLYIVATDDTAPILHWLMIGHVEATDIWCQIPLSWDEADDFIQNPAILMDGYIAELSPRIITLIADPGRDPAVTHTFQTGETDTPALDALQQLRGDLPERVARGVITDEEATRFMRHIDQVYGSDTE